MCRDTKNHDLAILINHVRHPFCITLLVRVARVARVFDGTVLAISYGTRSELKDLCTQAKRWERDPYIWFRGLAFRAWWRG